MFHWSGFFSQFKDVNFVYDLIQSTSGILQKEYKGYTFPLAVAIVLSGQYEDDVDNSEEIVYTGQGGNDLLGNKRQIEDQKMIRGNLALKVCLLYFYFLLCFSFCFLLIDMFFVSFCVI